MVKSPIRVGAIAVPAYTRSICPIACGVAGTHWIATSPRRSPGPRRHWPGCSAQMRHEGQHRLQGRRFSLDGDVAAEVTQAETALARLDATGNALANSEPLARLLLRAESVASSRIEDRRLLRADAAQRIGMEPRDETSRENSGQHRCDDVGCGLGEPR